MPKNKVLDFLIVSQDFDYSLKDIANYSEISYPCMKKLKKELIKNNWIVLTRKVGRAQMYKLNLESEKVQKFIEFYWSVVNEEIDEHLNQEKISSVSGPSAIPVSVKAM